MTHSFFPLTLKGGDNQILPTKSQVVHFLVVSEVAALDTASATPEACMPLARTAAARLSVALLAAAGGVEDPGPMRMSFLTSEGCARAKLMAVRPPRECDTKFVDLMSYLGEAGMPARSETRLSIVTTDEALVGVKP